MNAPHADLRERYLRDRVLTATPAQRVVMLYDRLLLDLTFATQAADDVDAGPHLSHGMLVVAELQSSLDPTAGGPADNLARIYGYLIHELVGARTGGREGLPGLVGIVSSLRESWAAAIEQLNGGDATASAASESNAASLSSAAFRSDAPSRSSADTATPRRVTAPAGAWIG